MRRLRLFAISAGLVALPFVLAQSPTPPPAPPPVQVLTGGAIAGTTVIATAGAIQCTFKNPGPPIDYLLTSAMFGPGNKSIAIACGPLNAAAQALVSAGATLPGPNDSVFGGWSRGADGISWQITNITSGAATSISSTIQLQVWANGAPGSANF